MSNDKRISDTMEQALNKQMMEEATQAQAYIALGSWAEVNNYPGIADFFYKHSAEERNHMFKFLAYINERGGEAKIEAIPAPRDNPVSLETCIEDVWQHELENSKKSMHLWTKRWQSAIGQRLISYNGLSKNKSKKNH